VSRPDETAVDAKTVADFLGVHLTTVYSYAASGDIPGFKIGRRWRFFLSDVREHVTRTPDPWALPSRVDRAWRKRR
jgi:excisionase family DNA binding protein